MTDTDNTVEYTNTLLKEGVGSIQTVWSEWIRKTVCAEERQRYPIWRRSFRVWVEGPDGCTEHRSTGLYVGRSGVKWVCPYRTGTDDGYAAKSGVAIYIHKKCEIYLHVESH